MKIENVLSAKSIWFMDIAKLNPRGRNLYRVIVPLLVQWYGFKEPQEPFDERSGVRFLNGEFSPTQDGRDLTGVNLTIYFNGVVVQTQTSTDDSDRFLQQALTRLTKDGHIAYRTDLVDRKGYISEVVARADRPLTLLPQLADFCKVLSNAVYPNRTETVFKPSGIIFDTEPELTHRMNQVFSFERRHGEPWSENLYFSQGPLSTSQHGAILNDLEQVLAT